VPPHQTRQPESRSDAPTQTVHRLRLPVPKVDLNTASEKDLDELPGVEESVLTFPLAKPLKVTAVQ
jgi:DNA uptake protein ComE-like DNA-binding protein